MKYTTEEIETNLRNLEHLMSEIGETMQKSGKSYNEVIEDIKKDPKKKEIWVKGAEARIQKNRKESMTVSYDAPMMSDEELIKMSVEELIEDPGAYHKKYSADEMTEEDLLKSEKEALIEKEYTGDPKYYHTIAKGKVEKLEYTDVTKKDKEGNEIIGEDGKPERMQEVAVVNYEARNYNQWSTPIESMSKEDRERIQRNAVLNIHAGEDAIGRKDIRTKLVNGEIVVKEEYSEEESKRRYKFTRENVVVDDVPYCKFFINDELIFTLDVEEMSRMSAFKALDYRYADINDTAVENKDPLERLCYEITKKSGIPVVPEELFDYLESGYLINGE